MQYPKYGEWCKQNVIEIINKQRIHESKKYLEEFIFNQNSDLYSSGVYTYEVADILYLINDNLDNLSKSLFSTVQRGFAEKYFQMAQEINPQIDMKIIRRNGDEYTDLLYRTIADITMHELKDAVMYAFEHGTEEVKEPKIPYVKTNIFNIVKAIKIRLIKIETVQINYIDPDTESENIFVGKFTDYLSHLSQSGIFSDTINWRYVDLFDSGKFLKKVI